MSSDSYREWTQLSQKFNETEAWQEDLFPDAQYRFMKEAGCLVVSLAIILWIISALWNIPKKKLSY